jgi:hypothetical protein
MAFRVLTGERMEAGARIDEGKGQNTRERKELGRG